MYRDRFAVVGNANKKTVKVYAFYAGRSGKIVFFTIHCNTFPAYIAVGGRPSKLSTQCECTVTPNVW